MKALVWATIDTLSCLLLVVLAAINPPVVEAHSAIETYGKWVVVATWASSDNDVDVWLEAPNGSKVWWQSPRSPIAHLEQDDQGLKEDGPGVNRERMVIREVRAGEYVVALHCYACYATPVTVTVQLWRLQGADIRVYTRQITLRWQRQEVTAFRFTLDAAGSLRDLNQLPKQIVSA